MGTIDASFRRPQAPWQTPSGLEAVLSRWRNASRHRGAFMLDRREPSLAPKTVPMPESLLPALRDVLVGRGIEQLYTHQVEAYTLARGGRDVVIATPTASGKSLCYNLPVLEALAAESEARALYLFPTKALSRDQEQALHSLMHGAGIHRGAITYDGDTPGDARRAAREKCALLVTNPDMLHAGILPHHANWARFFANLRYIVIDELHAYRGVFGSHLANVLRRLQRVASFHGSSPVLLFSSATIGNPREHASRIAGREVALIDHSGAPVGERQVLIYNPPVVNAELGIRQSYLKCAVRLTADLVESGVPTLLFGQSRHGVETMLKYLRDRMAKKKIDPARVQGYRGGYLPETRRRIEAGLRNGEVSCVVATNALELGIDIGSLDAVVCAGYPGTVAGLWQRFGRGGRRGGLSLALLVTSSAPLDQYVALDPAFVVGAPVEQARIDPDNLDILMQHLKCAAFELPFEAGETFGDLAADVTDEALAHLAQHRLLHAADHGDGRRTYHWASDAYPANHVSLRSASWDNFVIIDVELETTIAEMDWRSVHTMLHEQAIYQHDGEQYQVERLDYENHKAFIRKVAPDYYTTAMTHTRVNVIEEDRRDQLRFGPAAPAGGRDLTTGTGDVHIVEKVVGYKKIKFHTHENVGYGDVHLPEMQMHTSAFWLVFPEAVIDAQAHARPVVVDALRGLGRAMHTVAVAGLMVDPRDLGYTLGDRKDADEPPGKSIGAGPGFDPTIFLYDHIAGGIGLAARLYEERDRLLHRARQLIEACACVDGCPGCVGPAIGIGVPTPSARGLDRGTPQPGDHLAPDIRRKALLMEILSSIGVGAIH